VVDDGDAVREPVGLFQVLRREQQRAALRHELLDDRPGSSRGGGSTGVLQFSVCVVSSGGDRGLVRRASCSAQAACSSC
jgi:hypothetical protein